MVSLLSSRLICFMHLADSRVADRRPPHAQHSRQLFPLP